MLAIDSAARCIEPSSRGKSGDQRMRPEVSHRSCRSRLTIDGALADDLAYHPH
jgi:hypothetical protein